MVEPAVDEHPPRAWLRWGPWLVAGAAVGLLLRRLPIAVAERIITGRDSKPVGCGDSSVLECALDNVGSVGETLVELLVYVLAVSAALGLAGAVVIVIGLVRRTPLIAGIGVAIAVPGGWQLAGLGLALLG